MITDHFTKGELEALGVHEIETGGLVCIPLNDHETAEFADAYALAHGSITGYKGKRYTLGSKGNVIAIEGPTNAPSHIQMNRLGNQAFPGYTPEVEAMARVVIDDLKVRTPVGIRDQPIDTEFTI